MEGERRNVFFFVLLLPLRVASANQLPPTYVWFAYLDWQIFDVGCTPWCNLSYLSQLGFRLWLRPPRGYITSTVSERWRGTHLWEYLEDERKGPESLGKITFQEGKMSWLSFKTPKAGSMPTSTICLFKYTLKTMSCLLDEGHFLFYFLNPFYSDFFCHSMAFYWNNWDFFPFSVL